MPTTSQVAGLPLAAARPGVTAVTRPTPKPAASSRWLNSSTVKVLDQAVYRFSGRAS